MLIPALLADAVATKTSTVTTATDSVPVAPAGPEQQLGMPQPQPPALKTQSGRTVHVPPISLPPGETGAMQLPPPPIPKSPLATKAPWLTHSFAALFMMSAIALIVLLAVQTTKQEGLSGTLGGRVESAYRPRLGFDQQLQRVTTVVAVSFVLFGLLVSLSGI
jgi:protein translocase SecG subunit